MKSEDYWANRLEQLNEAQLHKGEAYAKRMKAEYDQAMAKIQRDTEAWYARLAKNNDVSLAGARQLLKANELKEFKWDVKEYIKAGKENAIDQRWMKELENASAKVHINKLQAQQIQMRQHIESLTALKQSGAHGLLGGIYKDNYYKSVFELQKGTGLGSSFAKIDKRQLEILLTKPWAPDGKNFSARIWGNRDKLLHEMNTALVQGLIRGTPPDKVIGEFANRMNVSRSDAERLILTESAFFSGASRRAAYEELNIDECKNVATLDKKTSTICRHMDGTIFLLSDAQPGVNCAPFHARCRTVDIPHFTDNVKERAARGDDGKTYNVPGDMNYPEWAEKYAGDAKEQPRLSKPREPDNNPSNSLGGVDEPKGTPNRRYNPKASYHLDLPAVPEVAAEQLATVNREIVRIGHKEAKETAVVLDNKTGSELGRLSGTINKVAFTKEFDKTLREAPDNSIILTHNHPSGSRINIMDIQNLARYRSLSSVVAAGHSGGMSAVSTMGATTDLLVFNDIMAKSAQKVKQRLQADARYAIMSTSEKARYFGHAVMLVVIEEMGWEYVEDYATAKGSTDWGI